MTRLILVRHGQSEANEKKIGAGQLDYPLTELGHRQAERTAAYLAEHETIDCVYSSDLSRAVDTARPLAERLGLSIHTDPALREINSGLFAGLLFSERNERFPEEVARLRADFSHMQYPEGEYVPEVYDRVVGCISRIAEAHPDECVLIASHGGTIRVFHAFSEGFSREEAGNVPTGENASISVFEWEEGQARPVTLYFTDHLRETVSLSDEHTRI
jgi:probable phosphoglycerate mutase